MRVRDPHSHCGMCQAPRRVGGMGRRAGAIFEGAGSNGSYTYGVGHSRSMREPDTSIGDSGSTPERALPAVFDVRMQRVRELYRDVSLERAPFCPLRNVRAITLLRIPVVPRRRRYATAALAYIGIHLPVGVEGGFKTDGGLTVRDSGQSERQDEEYAIDNDGRRSGIAHVATRFLRKEEVARRKRRPRETAPTGVRTGAA